MSGAIGPRTVTCRGGPLDGTVVQATGTTFIYYTLKDGLAPDAVEFVQHLYRLRSGEMHYEGQQ
jgi:hypothetical protein